MPKCILINKLIIQPNPIKYEQKKNIGASQWIFFFQISNVVPLASIPRGDLELELNGNKSIEHVLKKYF